MQRIRGTWLRKLISKDRDADAWLTLWLRLPDLEGLAVRSEDHLMLQGPRLEDTIRNFIDAQRIDRVLAVHVIVTKDSACPTAGPKAQERHRPATWRLESLTLAEIPG
jgi:hypothetical protein